MEVADLVKSIPNPPIQLLASLPRAAVRTGEKRLPVITRVVQNDAILELGADPDRIAVYLAEISHGPISGIASRLPQVVRRYNAQHGHAHTLTLPESGAGDNPAGRVERARGMTARTARSSAGSRWTMAVVSDESSSLAVDQAGSIRLGYEVEAEDPNIAFEMPTQDEI